MEEDFEIKYHELEENHWWFKARRDIILKLIKTQKRKEKILEVGCSGGPLLKSLKISGYNRVFGIDISERAIELCRKRGLEHVYVMDGSETSFSNNEFDVLIASDIMEHMEKDSLALKEWHRIIKPGGILIIFVPAFDFLWSSHDTVNRHFRRYTKSSLSEALIHAGFKIERSSYWNFFLFVPVLMTRFFQRVFSKEKKNKGFQLFRFGPLSNNVFYRLLVFENRILNKTNFPVGISVFALAIKT